MPGAVDLVIDEPAVALLVGFAELAVEGLGAAREEIDALNVYPVPDGDTGTNMFLTVEHARDALLDRIEAGAEAGASMTLPVGLAAYSRGALLGARGNSGVILSQLFGALLRRMSRPLPGESPAEVVAESLQVSVEAAYAAVGEPVEGTILTVARAAADAASAATHAGQESAGQENIGQVNGDGERPVTLEHVLHEATTAARVALSRTTEQLPRLREAGVVDAGGAGLCVVLEAAEQAVTGRRADVPPGGLRRRPIPTPESPDTEPGDDLVADGPAYEVMYLLDAEDEAVATLRESLAPLGDSLVVVGGEGLWNVHVHVDDVGAAIEAGIRAGAPRRIRVTHFAEQLGARSAARRKTRTGRHVVAVADGPGLAALFAEAGAHPIEGGAGRRPSTGALLAAVRECSGEEVVLLPNDADTVAAAEATARAAADLGIKVVVVPTTAQVQGIAALAVHEPGRPLEADVVAMTSAARHARHGAVTVAARQAMTSAGPCEPGDVLGAIEGDFVLIGHDLGAVSHGVLDRLLANGGELVTLVAGAEGTGGPALAEEVAAWVERAHPGVDVVRHDGGQEHYPLLLAVE